MPPFFKSMTDKNLEYVKSQCSANKHLEYRGAVAVSLRSRFKNEDYTALDLVFSEKIHLRFFDPERSIMERIRQYEVFTALCKCLGTDFLNIPPCPGGWEDFVIEFTSLLATHKYTLLYAKITINEEGRIVPGTGTCFSLEPNMEYSDEDLRFLDSDETYRPNNLVAVDDLPSAPKRNVAEIEQAEIVEPKGKKTDKVEAESDTWELGMKDPMKPADVVPFQEEPKSVFEEYNETHAERPEWLDAAVEEHAPKVKPTRKPRAKKKEPISLEMNKEGLEDIGYDDLPF